MMEYTKTYVGAAVFLDRAGDGFADGDDALSRKTDGRATEVSPRNRAEERNQGVNRLLPSQFMNFLAADCQ